MPRRFPVPAGRTLSRDNSLIVTMLNPLQLAAQNFVQEMGAQVMRGFNGRFNSQSTQRAIAHEMEEYFQRVKRGEEQLPPSMTEYVMTVATEACRAMLGDSGAQEEVQSVQRYKEFLDKLKDESVISRQKDLINEHFDGLTEEETNVLLECARDISLRQHAKSVGLSEMQFLDVKRSLASKLKHQTK